MTAKQLKIKDRFYFEAWAFGLCLAEVVSFSEKEAIINYTHKKRKDWYFGAILPLDCEVALDTPAFLLKYRLTGKL